jgi:hypothetical protein
VTIALTVLGNGRLDYLHQAVDSALQHLPVMDHYLMVDDSGDPSVRDELELNYPNFRLSAHAENLGMAFSVADGFSLVGETDADYVFWLEEDMVLTGPPPINEALDILQAVPTLAQMLFERQPLTPEEHAAGSVHGAMGGTNHGPWTEHRHLFSLNPCLIPRQVLTYGWPAGPLGVGNETGMTHQLLHAGYTFGVWHGQHVEHIGQDRAPAWKL